MAAIPMAARREPDGAPIRTPRAYGARGDGTADDTEAIQAALDDTTTRAPLYFPAGTYRVTGGLTLSRNVDIIGAGSRAVTIRGDGLPSGTDLFSVAITENWGFLDCRGWQMRDLALLLNGGGRHGLNLATGGMPMLAYSVENVSSGGVAGDGLNITAGWAHGSVRRCRLDRIKMAGGDRTIFSELMLYAGQGAAVTIDVVTGVRNVTVKDSTIIARDGHLHVIDGSNVRFENNQCEQIGSLSQHPHSAMAWVEGRTRSADNVLISGNNLGGGTNLNRLVVIGNARRAVIDRNNLVAVGTSPAFDGYEIEVLAGAERTVIRDNFTLSQALNPRDYWSPRILDGGTNTSVA